MSRLTSSVSALLDLAAAVQAADAKIDQAGNLDVVISEQCAKLDRLRKDCADAEDEAARTRSESAAHKRAVDIETSAHLDACSKQAAQLLHDAKEESEAFLAVKSAQAVELANKANMLEATCAALEGEQAVLSNSVSTLKAELAALRSKLL